MEKENNSGGLFAAAAVFAAAVLAALTKPPEAGAWFWFCILWLVLFAVTLLARDSEADKSRTTGFIKRRDNAIVYSAATAAILKHLARMMAPETAQNKPCPQTGFLAKLEWYLTPRAVDTADLNRLRQSPWSCPVMDMALKLAVIYPLLLLLGQWAVTGGDTGIGEATILFAIDEAWVRYAILNPVTLLIIAAVTASAFQFERLNNALILAAFGGGAAMIVFAKFTVAAAVAVTLAYTVAAASLFSGAVAGAFAVAGVVGFVFAITDVTRSAVIALVALSGILAVAYACQKQAGRASYILFSAIAYGSFVIVLSQVPVTEDARRNIAFALGLLPLLNAMFDYLSYGVTLTLLKYGARKNDFRSFIVAGIDAVMAYVLLVGLGCAIVLTVALINALGQSPMLDIASVFADLRNPETRGGYTWLYLTLFSTLLPTGLHLVIGIFSITTWLPMKAKVWIADMIDREDTGSGGSIFGGILAAFVGAVWCFAIALMLWEGGSWVVSNIGAICLSVLAQVEYLTRALGVI